MSKANKDIAPAPLWETHARKPLTGGRVPGIDGSMWLYAALPMAAVVDAKSPEDAVRVGAPLEILFRELSSMATSRGVNRRLARKSYRKFHIQLTNFPRWYEAPKGSPIAGYLNSAFRNTQVLRRQVLVGVRLVPTTSGGFTGWVGSNIHTYFDGGVPVSDYDKDFAAVSAAFSRAGFTVPTAEQFRNAEAWWNHGMNSDTPILKHPEHMHFFRSMASAAIAQKKGLADCDPWLDVKDHMAVTFCSVSDFDIGYMPVTDRALLWASELVSSSARVISIRGEVEPPGVTRQELKAQRKAVRADLADAAANNKMDRAAQEEKEAELDDIERSYDVNKDAMPPTLVDTSIVVGFAGIPEDISQLTSGHISVHPMANRQGDAWHESMLCSNVRSNPYLHDLPATTVAYSGLPNLSVVGDADGALLGFTADQQPAYLSPTAASAADGAPILLCAAATGAGKSVAAQWIAYQHARMGRPTVFIDPKQDSDFSAIVELCGGNVISLDDFLSSDGGLDPLGLFPTPQMGIPLAASMLFQVNPWGDDRRRAYEADIANAIRYGVENGAVATGQALKMAYDAGVVSDAVVGDVFKVAEVYPMFRATFGMSGGSQLAVHNGLTLFKVGKTDLDRPPQGMSGASADLSATQRQSMNLLRMLVRGSMLALTGRGGVLHMDEAWILERSAPDELEALGRLGRSQNVLAVLYTQTPTGPLNLGLKGYISRGLIGHISDEEQAAAGLELFNALRPETLHRVTAKENLSGGAGLDWSSLKALTERTPDGKKRVLRGSVFYYSDLQQRLAPVTINLPPDFLEMASTTPEDVAKRPGRTDIRPSRAVSQG